MGPAEKLVVRAWGLGIRIDAGDRGKSDEHAKALLALLEEARRLDRESETRVSDPTRSSRPPSRSGASRGA